MQIQLGAPKKPNSSMRGLWFVAAVAAVLAAADEPKKKQKNQKRPKKQQKQKDCRRAGGLYG